MFKRFLDDVSDIVRGINTLILDGLRDIFFQFSKDLSSLLSLSEDWKRLHRDNVVAPMKGGQLLYTTLI